MKQTRTRILSLLMVLAMCLSLLPVTALAAEGEGGEVSYVITFDAAGGKFPDGSSTKQMTTQQVSGANGPENLVEAPPEPTREGYTFKGWYRSYSGEYPSVFNYNFTSDATVYAEWEKIGGEGVYLITFDPNGGTVTPTSKETDSDGRVPGGYPTPVREGYRFLGWVTGDGYHPADDDYWGGNQLLTAEWEKIAEMVITFDPNGGSCDVKTLPLEDGGILKGPLPTPTRAGYTFEGWYRWYESDSKKGRKIEAGESFTAPETVTAVWVKDGAETQKSVRIDFFANGGRITWFCGQQVPALKDGEPPISLADGSGIDQNSGIGWTFTDERGTLSSIPVAEREGYTFDGWYKLTDGVSFWDVVGSNYFSEAFTNLSGQKLTESTVNTAAATYAAKWVKGGLFTVTFDLNGAKGDVPAPQKVEKGKKVNLPKLGDLNGTFVGWGYSEDGKTLKEWKADYTVTADLTLYAMWGTDDDMLKGLTYRFGNYHEAFGYPNPYRIPQARYELIFGKVQGQALYQRDGQGAWGGNCYGMAATSGMFFYGDVTTSSFRTGAAVPYDLNQSDKNSTLNMTLTEYIEAVFVSQSDPSIQADYLTPANLDALSRTAAAVKTTKKPVMVAIRGEAFTEDGQRVNAGHAVLAYDVVEVSSTESHLMIYDPNFPSTERYITLAKSGSSYRSWSYKLNDTYDWGTGRLYSAISVVPYEDYTQMWTGRANKANYPALFSTTAQNASILDSTGAVAATIKNGELTTSSSDVTPILSYGVTSDGYVPTSNSAAMWLPAGQYTLETTGSSKEITAVLADVEQSAAVTTSASSVTFAVSDGKAVNYVQIGQSGASYDITLSSTLDKGAEKVQLTGTTAADGVSIAQADGTLYVSGAGDKTTLKVEGKITDLATVSKNMPDIKALLTASAPAQTPQTPEQKPSAANPFTDVASNAYYYEAVLWAVEKSITSGTTPTTFGPEEPCTRAQIVTFLWKAAGSPKPASSNNPFTDVKAGEYYYDAVLWAVEKNITSGTTPTTFSPFDTCTRGQTVTFLYRAAGSPKAGGSANPFRDVASDAYYYNAVLWAVEQKITSGTTPATFGPEETVTRGQTVTFLYRSQGK